MTMKKLMGSVLAIAVATALSAGAAIGADDKGGKAKGKNEGPKAAVKAPSAASNAHLAQSLVRYGDANKDAIAMITAARILAATGAEDKNRDKKAQGGKGEEAKQGADMTVAGILARAKQYAGDRKDVIAMADDVAASGSRGRSGGPGRSVTVVRTGATDVFTETFRGGESAFVGISGDGDSDLDLYVYDENGNLICRSTTAGDDEACRWNPRWTGPFRIQVRNLGVANRYLIVTN